MRQDYAAMRDMYLTEPVSFDQIIATLVTVERQIKSHRAPASEAD